MSFLGKVFVILNLILAVLFTGVTAVIYTLRVDFKAKNQELVSEQEAFNAFMTARKFRSSAEVSSMRQKEEFPIFIEAAETVQRDLEASTEKFTAQINRITEEATLKDRRVADMETRLAEEKSKRKSAEDEARDAELERKKLLSSVENLSSRLDDLKTLKDDAEDKLRQSKAKFDDIYVENLAFKNSVSSLKQNLDIAKTEMEGISSKYESATKVLKAIYRVNPEMENIGLNGGGAAKGPTIRGVVLGVRPTLNLVMIDKGEVHGVKAGTQFIIHRKGNFVGRIEVDKVTPEFSFGKITLQKVDIKQGDKATNRLEQ
tara:strand:+ start:1258 stop:2208 length:951 start_codon:yes stop_codon:yes gene_type:complete